MKTKNLGPEQKHLRTNLRFGFTLIELLVVVLIIGILAAVALPQYQLAVAKSRFTEALTNLKVLGNAVDAYRMANGGAMPATLNDLDVTVGAVLDGKHLEEGKWSYLLDSYGPTIYAAPSRESNVTVEQRVDVDYAPEQKVYYCKSYTAGGLGEKVCGSFSNNCRTRVNIGNCSSLRCCQLN